MRLNRIARACGVRHRSAGSPVSQSPVLMRALACATGIAMALSATACSVLPIASSPHPFDVPTPSAEPVEVAAGGPAQGSTPDMLVSDFLLACAAGTTDDFAAARLYLTEKAAQTWQPTTMIQVYATASTPSTQLQEGTGDVTTEVTAPAVATIDANGVLTPSESGSQIVRSFHLVQEDGQWRIDSLDDGVMVSEASLAASHQLVSLYFPSNDGGALVPDPRWYPIRRLATHLMEGLLAGPSQSIAPAVTSAIPEGVALGAGGISVDNQVASVALNGQVAPVQDPTELYWQIYTTLTQSTSVTSVRIVSEGATIEDLAVPLGPDYRMDSAVGISDTGFVSVSGNSTRLLLTPEQIGPDASKPAIGPTSDAAMAWVGQDTVYIADGDGGQVAHPVASPSWPSVDRFDMAWATSSTTPGSPIYIMGLGGTYIELPSPFDHSHTIHSVEVSPDGARLALIREVGTTRSVWVAPIVRDPQGVPTSVGTPIQVSATSATVNDVSWAGTVTLVFDESASDSSPQIRIEPLGGFGSTMPVPGEVEMISGGATPSNIYIRTREGNLYSRSGSVWQAVGAPVREISYPG